MWGRVLITTCPYKRQYIIPNMDLERAMLRFGKNVCRIRKSRRLTQEDMRDLGFNYRYFQKIEAGEVNPTLGTLVRLAKVLNCTMAELLE